MTGRYGHDRKSRISHFLAFLTAACTGCVMDAAPEGHAAQHILGAPSAVFTDVRPLDRTAIVYEPLAPRVAGAALDAQLSIDVVVTNNQTTSIDVDHVRLSYSGGGARPADTLETGIQKKCGNEGVVDLTADRAIAPGESCRLILLPDLKLALPAPTQVTMTCFSPAYAADLREPRAAGAPQRARRG